MNNFIVKKIKIAIQNERIRRGRHLQSTDEESFLDRLFDDKSVESDIFYLIMGLLLGIIFRMNGGHLT
jgi:hypothetical protein